MQKLKASDRIGLFWLDIFMIWLVIQNLLFFGFDWFFNYSFFQDIVYFISPVFYRWYETKVHPYFSNWDMIFVTIFFAEFLFRWIRATKKYPDEIWWYYPINHWYDVLGMIPMKGTFKFLRLFRLVAMVLKLHKVGAIDIKSTRIYSYFNRFSEVFVEEVSDRVIAKTLTMVQAELSKGIPISEKIIAEVVSPKQEQLVDFISSTISNTTEMVYFKYREQLKENLDTKVIAALQDNREIDALRYIPGVGRVFQRMLDSAVSDVTFNVVDNLILDVTKNESKDLIKSITNDIILAIKKESEDGLIDNQMVINTITEIIEIIKLDVLRKNWKSQSN